VRDHWRGQGARLPLRGRPAAPDSAQALAEAAGFTQTGLSGWFLPTGNGQRSAGPENQYLSIWNDVGGSLANLQAQFDGVRFGDYWSGTELASGVAWYFGPSGGGQFSGPKSTLFFAVAVRPGDVTASVPVATVPEPRTLALALLALGATVVARRRQAR
jgi:hypothetical protein